MKKAILILSAILSFNASFGQGQTFVHGYYRSNGTYVEGHYRTTPNYTKNDNWSTVGNVNPYTGAEGTKPGGYNSPYSSYGNYPSRNYDSKSLNTPAYSQPTQPAYEPTYYYSSNCNCYIQR